MSDFDQDCSLVHRRLSSGQLEQLQMAVVPGEWSRATVVFAMESVCCVLWCKDFVGCDGCSGSAESAARIRLYSSCECIKIGPHI